MFFAMKGWLEHGLNLREGTYKQETPIVWSPLRDC